MARHPEEYKRKVEESQDNSKSAQRERALEAANVEKEEAERKERSWKRRIWRKIRHGSVSSKGKVQEAKGKNDNVVSKPGLDVESAIPPAGKRDTVSGS